MFDELLQYCPAYVVLIPIILFFLLIKSSDFNESHYSLYSAYYG